MTKKKKGISKTSQGAHFYSREKGLRAILVYVPKETHEALLTLAREEDRSLQNTVKRILNQSVASKK